jgi:hypothetical protein
VLVLHRRSSPGRARAARIPGWRAFRARSCSSRA